jgi:DNA-binding response OmpR family regulator
VPDPKDPESQWRPLLHELSYERSILRAGVGSFLLSTVMSIDEFLNAGESGYSICPPPARKLSAMTAGDVATFADIVLDRQSCRVRRGKRDVHLGPTEFRLLDVLMQRPGRVYSREQLLDRVWGLDVYVEIRTVDVHIGRLRTALNRRGDRDPIRTVRSSGYALDETYSV